MAHMDLKWQNTTMEWNKGQMKHDEAMPHALQCFSMLFMWASLSKSGGNPQQSLLNHNLDALSIALFTTVKKMEIE